MNRPWMPLYIPDYIADTAHLDAAESGAYLHLIMHYWMNDGLPDDDKMLARIAKMKPSQWRSARPILQEFFIDGWKHKRVEFEMTEAARISKAGQIGGKASAEARRLAKRTANEPPTTRQRSLNDTSNDPATEPQRQANESSSPTTTSTKNLTSSESGTARAKGSLAGEMKTKIVEIYQALGLEPVPDTGLADVWIAQGFNHEICTAKVREMLGRKKSLVPLSYFTNAIQEAHEKRPNGTTNGHAKISEPDKDPDEKTQHAMAKIWVNSGFDNWNFDMPQPGKPGCKINWEILRQHSIDPETGKSLDPKSRYYARPKAGTEFD